MVGTIEYPLVNAEEVAGQAWAATERGDAEEALRLWQRLRQDFPDRPEGYVWATQLLWQRGRLDEADAMAAEAYARFPENPDVLVQSGWVAMVREQWDEALRWWSAVRSRAPDRIDGYLWATRALWSLSRFKEADAMAADALRRFPGSAEIETERAWIAVNLGDWNEALARWQLVLAAQPGRREAQIGLIQAMRWLGQADKAEPIARTALASRPDDPDLLIEHIWLAADRVDWTEASARLTAARDTLAAAGRFEATREAIEARRRTARVRVGIGDAPAAGGDTSEEISVADLMLSFESLGERCDFGAVQRRYGVEPLGLLRFSYAPFDALIAALGERFAAIGTVEDTGFERYQDETILRMKKYGLIFHTFVSQKDLRTPERIAAFREQQRRRLVFLKRKLIDDLEEPQKICVYTSDERTSDADAARLFAALRAYGPNALLYVRPADARHRLGTIEILGDGLYIGYYPGLADFVAGQQPDFDVWRELCRRTYECVRRDGGGPLSG